MGKIFVDKATVYASGNVPASETASSGIDIRGMDGVQFLVKYSGGGYAGVHMRPQFAFLQFGHDADGVENIVTDLSPTYFDGTIVEWDSTNDRGDLEDNVTRISATSGTVIHKLVAYDNPGATIMRLQVQGSGLTGDIAGAIEIEAVRVSETYRALKVGW